MRIGQGYDVHAFGVGNQLILGGVHIPFDRAFVAHSDGDVLVHALMDALLGVWGWVILASISQIQMSNIAVVTALSCLV